MNTKYPRFLVLYRNRHRKSLIITDGEKILNTLVTFYVGYAVFDRTKLEIFGGKNRFMGHVTRPRCVIVWPKVNKKPPIGQKFGFLSIFIDSPSTHSHTDDGVTHTTRDDGLRLSREFGCHSPNHVSHFIMVGGMVFSGRNGVIRYTMKKNSQQAMNPPTTMDSVWAVLFSRFSETRQSSPLRKLTQIFVTLVICGSRVYIVSITISSQHCELLIRSPRVPRHKRFVQFYHRSGQPDRNRCPARPQRN